MRKLFVIGGILVFLLGAGAYVWWRFIRKPSDNAEFHYAILDEAGDQVGRLLICLGSYYAVTQEDVELEDNEGPFVYLVGRFRLEVSDRRGRSDACQDCFGGGDGIRYYPAAQLVLCDRNDLKIRLDDDGATGVLKITPMYYFEGIWDFQSQYRLALTARSRRNRPSWY